MGAIEGQRGIVQHGAGKRAGGPAADLKRAGGDYRATCIGVAAGEREDSRPGLRQASGPADRAGKGLGAKELKTRALKSATGPGANTPLPLTTSVPAPTVVVPLEVYNGVFTPASVSVAGPALVKEPSTTLLIVRLAGVEVDAKGVGMVPK